MKTKTKEIKKLNYEAPMLHSLELELEYSIASGSGGAAAGGIEQVWDAEETKTESKNDGWW